MPAQSRLGDKSHVPADAHGCPACPHSAIGPAVGGSPDVFVNGKPALRVGDPGIHAACCGPNTWTAKLGSSTVIINGKPAHRLNDVDQHCGGIGKMIEGSSDVFCGGAPTASATVSGKAQSAALSNAPPGGPGSSTSVGALAGLALAKAQKLGANKLTELANNGLGKLLEKLGLPPALISKIKQVVGPMIHSIVDDLVHGRTLDLGKAFGAGLEAVKGLALGEIKDKIMGPLKEKIGDLTKGLNSAMLSGLGPATSKLDGAIKGAIAGAVSGAVGGALNGGLNGFVDSAFKGENPLAGAWEGIKGGAKSGAGSGAWDGGKDGWKEYDKRNKALMAWQEEQKKLGPQPEKVVKEAKVKKKGAPKKPAEPEYSGPAWYEKKKGQGAAGGQTTAGGSAPQMGDGPAPVECIPYTPGGTLPEKIVNFPVLGPLIDHMSLGLAGTAATAGEIWGSPNSGFTAAKAASREVLGKAGGAIGIGLGLAEATASSVAAPIVAPVAVIANAELGSIVGSEMGNALGKKLQVSIYGDECPDGTVPKPK